MMEDTDRQLDEDCFFDLVDIGELPPSVTLEQISGLKGSAPPYATNMVQWAEEAWRTPFAELTCEQVRLLVSQKMGLEWLGKPAIGFARQHPDAIITNYPGEMVLLCLRAAPDLAEVAREEFVDWLSDDFGWMDRVYEWDEEEDLVAQANMALAAARSLIRLQ